MAEKNQNQIRDKIPGGKRPNQGGDNDKRNKFNSFLLPVLIGMAILSIILVNNGKSPIEIEWKDLIEMLNKHDIEKIVIVNQTFAEIYIKNDRLDKPEYSEVLNRGLSHFARTGPHYTYKFASVDQFLKDLEDAQAGFPKDEIIRPKGENRKDIFGELITWLLPLLILIAIWLFIFRRMSGAGGGAGGAGSIFNVGKSRAKIFDKDTSVKVDFKDVAGLEEAKMEVMEIVEFLKKPKKYTELGGKIPKGALLLGAPGTGKTLLARAVAGEAGVPFFSMSGSDFVVAKEVQRQPGCFS